MRARPGSGAPAARCRAPIAAGPALPPCDPRSGSRSRPGSPAAASGCGPGLPVELDAPAVNGSTPKRARATSVRPAPASPASPTISPGRTSRSMSCSLPTAPPRTCSRGHRRSPRRRRAAGSSDPCSRPTIIRTSSPGRTRVARDGVDPAPVLEDGDRAAPARRSLSAGARCRARPARVAAGAAPARRGRRPRAATARRSARP